MLLSIVVLLSDPNPEDPLRSDIAQLLICDRTEHDRIAAEWTRKYATFNIASNPSDDESNVTSTSEVIAPAILETTTPAPETVQSSEAHLTIDAPPAFASQSTPAVSS